MFQKYFEKKNPEIIFKKGKTIFPVNDGVQKDIC